MNAIEAIRTSAAFAMIDHVTAVRLTGSEAFAALDRVCPRKLFMRDGQMLHTLLLRDDARPLADIYICPDDGGFLVLAEGVSAAQLAELLPGAEVEDLLLTHRLISLDGPYAWEVFAELAGPEVIGQPYMTFFHADDLTAFRAGKTGEFGYLLMVPTERAQPLRTTLMDRGGAFDLVEADLAALDQCALENWYFNMRREGLADATPIELQLQWRVTAGKSFVGADALTARRKTATQRLVQCAGAGAMSIGDRVMYGDAPIGTVVNAGFSPVRGDWVATALVDRAYSHARVTAYTVGGSPISTLAAPALDNRSLYVNPQQHSYHTRHEVEFPPVAKSRA